MSRPSPAMSELVAHAKSSLARVRRRADDPIPDGEGSLFERTAVWLAIEDQMRHINHLAASIHPELGLIVDEFRATRLLYECGKVKYDAVRVAQRAVGEAISQTILSEEVFAFDPLHDLWTGLQQLLAEYRRIGGPVDREPCEGPPG